MANEQIAASLKDIRVMRPLFIDCDPGHDDAIAILLALASPEIDVRGITTAAGNQTIERTTRNALGVLALAGRDGVPVARGGWHWGNAVSAPFQCRYRPSWQSRPDR